MTSATSKPPVVAAEVPPRTVASIYPEAFAKRFGGRIKRQLGNVFDLSNFGVNLTTLEPGVFSALRHWHSKQDEFVYILEGEATLTTNAGVTTLTPGMCVGFKAGVEDGHQISNRGTSRLVYLEVGDRTPGDRGFYPDDDIEATLNAQGQWEFAHKDGSPYR
jgi:uncharacterized cupin superfamily protein